MEKEKQFPGWLKQQPHTVLAGLQVNKAPAVHLGSVGTRPQAQEAPEGLGGSPGRERLPRPPAALTRAWSFIVILPTGKRHRPWLLRDQCWDQGKQAGASDLGRSFGKGLVRDAALLWPKGGLLPYLGAGFGKAWPAVWGGPFHPSESSETTSRELSLGALLRA